MEKTGYHFPENAELPGIGARIVTRIRVRVELGSCTDQSFRLPAMITPKITGKIFRKCFPVALKPTRQKMEHRW